MFYLAAGCLCIFQSLEDITEKKMKKGMNENKRTEYMRTFFFFES